MYPHHTPDTHTKTIPAPPCLLGTLGKVFAWLLLIAVTAMMVSVVSFGAFSLYSGELIAPRHLPVETRLVALICNTFAALIILCLAIRGLYPDPNAA